MAELTKKAEKNLEEGGTTGPGTHVCRNGCRKEPTRLNSTYCRGCQTKPVREAQVVRVTLPRAVFDALQTEADAKDQSVPDMLAALVTARHHRKTGASPSTSTQPSNKKE